MIYVHVPFCRSFCTYCDFYSEVTSRCDDAWSDFSDALAREAEARACEMNREVNTLYIGGGTPSVLPLSVFEDLSFALQRAGQGAPFDEFTVEVNPDDVVRKGQAYIEGLLKLGVNRISMGVQSFDDGILRWMNRRHDSATARKAYAILEDAGVGNISIDLIFGLPQLSDKVWRKTLMQALDISEHGVVPKHISSYQLSVEPGSALARMVERGQWTEASDEKCERQYDILCETLESAYGYHHYEISNFAQPGYEAMHNSAYWRHVPYVGLGPGAHSLSIYRSINSDAPRMHGQHDCHPVSAGQAPGLDLATGETSEDVYVRQWNEPDLKQYLKDPLSAQDREILTSDQVMIERVMLGLRTSAGLQESFLRKHCNPSLLDNAIRSGDLVRTCGSNLRIPKEKFFVSDSIISALI